MRLQTNKKSLWLLASQTVRGGWICIGNYAHTYIAIQCGPHMICLLNLFILIFSRRAVIKRPGLQQGQTIKHIKDHNNAKYSTAYIGPGMPLTPGMGETFGMGLPGVLGAPGAGAGSGASRSKFMCQRMKTLRKSENRRNKMAILASIFCTSSVIATSNGT